MQQTNEKEMEATATRSWTRVFLIVSSFLVLFLILLVFWLGSGDGSDRWEKALRRDLRTAPADDAMVPFAKALRFVRWDDLEASTRKLEEAAMVEWKADPDIINLLQEHSRVVELITVSAGQPRSTFPITLALEENRPVPSIGRMQLLIQMLICNARFVDDRGHHGEAIQRLVEAAVTGARFARPVEEASLNSHMIAISSIELALVAMNQFVLSRSLSAESLFRLEQQLALLEANYLPITEAFNAELTSVAAKAEKRLESRQELANLLQFYDADLARPDALKEAETLLSSAPTFPGDWGKLLKLMEEDFRRPMWERTLLLPNWKRDHISHPIIQRILTDMGPLQVREAIMIARLRLTRALCRVGLNQMEFSDLIDPFTGAPMQSSKGVLYSVGPDRVVGDSLEFYNPAKGIYSQGELYIRLPD